MIAEKHLDILHERRAKVLAGGGEDKLQERHAKGLLGARERLLALFQPDTFQGRQGTAFGWRRGRHRLC